MGTSGPFQNSILTVNGFENVNKTFYRKMKWTPRSQNDVGEQVVVVVVVVVVIVIILFPT